MNERGNTQRHLEESRAGRKESRLDMARELGEERKVEIARERGSSGGQIKCVVRRPELLGNV